MTSRGVRGDLAWWTWGSRISYLPLRWLGSVIGGALISAIVQRELSDGDWELEERATEKSGGAGRRSVYKGSNPNGQIGNSGSGSTPTIS